MPYKYSSEEIVTKGETIFQQKVTSGLVSEEKGKYIAIDVDTEQVAVGDDELTVGDPIREKQPDAPIYVKRIGYKAVTRLGGGFRNVEVCS